MAKGPPIDHAEIKGKTLHAGAYSLPKTTDKLAVLFQEHLPELSRKDFYLLEIAFGADGSDLFTAVQQTIPTPLWRWKR